MIGRGTRQLDLYDFFSIFIPGATLLLGVVPLLPQKTKVPATAAIAILIVGGVVAGRSVHAARLYTVTEADAETHRDVFIDEIFSANISSDDLVQQFYKAAVSHFDDIGLPDDLGDLERKKHENDLDTLYSLVRSQIHMDSRGRSRTFQAIYDFYGNLYIVFSTFGVIYYGYAILNATQQSRFSLTIYQPVLGSYQVDPLLIGIFAGSVFLFGRYIFKQMRIKYRDIYVQYLMADFVVIVKGPAPQNQFES
ncbi:hypothetical protein [Haloarcula sp. Atlit-120R]|uniref:hypothetical protein n=1 Tax=Haloarcula sp. Atlit-120R TaxID=2282135 RepID=UPI000EF1E8E9|nr:hypothetical protein [Haloarcula sp. Atlit-120R]RLM39284.1 hypothetical protein DVK01_01615 [Haloarcula sp. Atlit-120R]